MAKDPAFLFYPGDYLRDTQCFSENVQVAYDRIMCEHMRNICITKQQLKFFTKRLNDEEVSELKNTLIEVNGGFQIEWVAESIIKRRSYSESRKKNREGKKDNISKTYDKHMEIENEIEIKDKHKPIENCIFWNDPEFKEAWKSWQEVRTKKKCSKSDRAIKMAIKKLMELSGGNKKKATQILDNSANGGWSDIYELKKEHGESDKKWSEKEKAMNDFEAQRISYPEMTDRDILNGMKLSKEIKLSLIETYNISQVK